MSRAVIEQLLYTIDEAFDAGEQGHSLLGNLRSVPDEAWFWVPEGGARCIFDIVQHIGECTYVYENHAFGGGSMRWDQPGTVPTVARDTPRSEVEEWLRKGHQRWRKSIAALESDSELLKERRANWGRDYETRWLVNVLIQHDLYHGGEINHLRALRQGNDTWQW